MTLCKNAFSLFDSQPQFECKSASDFDDNGNASKLTDKTHSNRSFLSITKGELDNVDDNVFSPRFDMTSSPWIAHGVISLLSKAKHSFYSHFQAKFLQWMHNVTHWKFGNEINSTPTLSCNMQWNETAQVADAGIQIAK